ncbi:MAG: hypothetical protein AAGE99_05895 [Chlamydiota bacterium]
MDTYINRSIEAGRALDVNEFNNEGGAFRIGEESESEESSFYDDTADVDTGNPRPAFKRNATQRLQLQAQPTKSFNNVQYMNRAYAAPAGPRQTYQGNPVEAMPRDANGNWVWITNRDDGNTGSWQRVGEPIRPDQIGEASYNGLTKGLGAETYAVDHHNFNQADITGLSDQGLNAKLGEYGLPVDGNRYERFRRLVNAKQDGDFMKHVANGNAPTEQQMVGLNQNRPSPGQQAIYPNSMRPGNAPPPPYPAPPAGEEPQPGRQMGMGELQAEGAAAEGQAAQAGRMTLGTFASRAIPVISLGLMAKGIYDTNKARKEAKELQQQQEDMKV